MSIWQRFSIRKNFDRNNRSYNCQVIALLVILLTIGVFLSISIGSTRISLHEIISAIKQGDITSKTYQIICFIRIPRTLAAILAEGRKPKAICILYGLTASTESIG